MALGVDEETLFPGEGAFDRFAEQVRRQGRLGLVGHVFFAAERSPVGDEFHGDPIGRHAQDGGDLVAVVPHALATRVDVKCAVLLRDRHGRLGLQKGMLDPLGEKHLVDGMG